jgi:hypothetical protein
MSLELEREQVVQALCRHYAQDALTTEELESRLEAAYRARDVNELHALTHGLPALTAPASGPTSAVASRRGAEAFASRAQERVLSVFGDVKKRGDWEVARHLRAITVLGALELDFREARILAGVTTIDVSATLAEVRIIVPPGLRVECDGNAILGEFKQKVPPVDFGDPDVPVLRITGLSVLAEVSVVMRLPDESAMDAFRRERLKR